MMPYGVNGPQWVNFTTTASIVCSALIRDAYKYAQEPDETGILMLGISNLSVLLLLQIDAEAQTLEIQFQEQFTQKFLLGTQIWF